jgi:DNA polymerase-3 subunit gamma/tau
LLKQQPGGGLATPSPVGSVAPPEGVKKKPPTPAPENGASNPRPLTAEALPEIWAQTLRKVPGFLSRFLEKAGIPAISAPNSLVLRFPAEYNAAKEHCQDSSSTTTVETALKELTGQPWAVRVESLAGSSPSGSPSFGEGHKGGAEPSDSRSNGSSSGGRRNAREEAEKLPLVKRALDTLGASFQRLDDGFGVLSDAPPNLDDAPGEDEP